jgi:light-regulated signal transduction histidine kinase (bacteriophytochrome)
MLPRNSIIPERAASYLLALAAVIVATGIRLALAPLLGVSLPFFLQFAAIVTLAWLYGRGPALLAIALSAAAGGYLFAPSAVAIIGFVITTLIVSLLLDFQRRTLERARSAEREQRRANEELERVNRDLEAFAYSASHDLREPLRTISLWSERLDKRHGAKLEPEAATSLAVIRASAKRMTALLDGLLQYATVAHVSHDFATAIDTDRLVADVLANLRGAIADAGATVTADSLPLVSAGEAHMTQVFQNLINNAVRYGGKHIRISAQEQDGFCVFSVADDGIGIDPEYNEQIFGLFKRLNAGEENNGSGLGLAICRRVVERYGGRIWVSRSKPGDGSTFSFSVPAHTARED